MWVHSIWDKYWPRAGYLDGPRQADGSGLMRMDGVPRTTQWFNPSLFDGQIMLHPYEPTTSFQLAAFGKKSKDLMMAVRDRARHCMEESLRIGPG